MERKKKKTGIQVGTSLILVAFVLLCLVAFAALSYAQADADYNKSKQAAERTTDYYKAVTQAEAKIAEVQANLNDYEDGESVEFDIPINANQRIHVTLLIEAGKCHTLTYNTVTSVPEEPTISDNGGLLF